ncbi:glutamine synthetase [Luedemannella flava]
MARRARDAGVELRMAFEIEWYLGTADGSPAATGPAYGMTQVVTLSDYARDLLEALDAQGVPVEQFHPEYAASQLEISVSPTNPVGAADRVVLARETIRAVSARHGLRASFAPVPVAGAVGNGMHLHFSAWSPTDAHLFANGPGRYGLTAPGESILAGVLDRLPALVGLAAPSVSSHLRRVPQRWAGAYQCWGRENREAALRFVTGAAGSRGAAANAEIKCCDASANPYLVVGAVCLIAVESLDKGLTLPAETLVDPATLTGADQPPRLPETAADAVERLLADAGLRAALGEELVDAHSAVRRAEVELFADRTAEQVAESVRWRY